MIEFCPIVDKELIKEQDFEGRMLSAQRDLERAIASLPGIEITSGGILRSLNEPFRLFFRVTDEKGLAFLTRCVDFRYWKYGYLWKVELSIGDQIYDDGHLPISYMLHSGPIIGEEACEQARSLLENMEYHINHKNFMNFFNLTVDDFDL